MASAPFWKTTQKIAMAQSQRLKSWKKQENYEKSGISLQIHFLWFGLQWKLLVQTMYKTMVRSVFEVIFAVPNPAFDMLCPLHGVKAVDWTDHRNFLYGIKMGYVGSENGQMDTIIALGRESFPILAPLTNAWLRKILSATRELMSTGLRLNRQMP